MLALEEDDLDLDNGTAFFRRALKLIKGRLSVAELKTKYSRRRVRIAPATIAAIEDHLLLARARGKERAAAGSCFVTAWATTFG